jgi:hypothetical protein
LLVLPSFLGAPNTAYKPRAAKKPYEKKPGQRKRARPPFAQTEKVHGRELAVQSVTPMQVSFPHIQTFVKIWRKSTAYKTDEKEICYHLSSKA